MPPKNVTVKIFKFLKICILEITSEEEVSTIQGISSVEAKIEDKNVKRKNKLTSGKLEQLRKEKVRKISSP